MVEPLPTGRLSHIELLGGLDDNAIGYLETHSHWRRFGPGDQILDKASDNRDVYIVVEGAVKVVNYSMAGREIALAHLSGGSCFGELSAVDGRLRSASVVALEDCLLASISPQIYVGLLIDHPKFAVNTLQRLTSIIRSCDERIMDLSSLDAVTRVYRQLLGLAEEDPAAPGQWLINALPTNNAIAALASTSRETVSRTISQLAVAGIVEKQRGTLHLRQRDQLVELAGILESELSC